MVYHKLSQAIRARYIRFRPTAWHGHISMRVEVYGCRGNVAFSSTKLAFHILAVLFHTRQKLANVATKNNNKKTKTKTKQKQKTRNVHRLALLSYKLSVNENFLPVLKIALAQKLLRQWSTR